jgi:lambda family phage portal protein
VNALDKLIAWASPARGLRRARARLQMEQVRRYDAAASGRRTDGWLTQSTSANAELQLSLPRLRDRHRELIRNNPWACRAKQAIVTHTIGFGITAKLNGNKTAQKKYKQWSDSTDCDADGRNNMAGLQVLAMGCVVEAGEVIVRRRWRLVTDRLAVPMQLQVLEPDYLDHSKTELLTGGARIIQGVEFDAIGRRVAYWLFEEHPGDIVGMPAVSKRVPAKDVIHVFRQDRPGQVRGVPWGAPTMLSMRDLDDYEDAYLFRQKIANCQVGVVHDMPDTAAISREQQKLPALSESFEPGRFDYLPEGKDITFNTPPAAGDYGPFTRAVLMRIAAAYGITFAALTGDLTKVNFSSGRMGNIDMGRNITTWQWAMLVPQLLDPVTAWFGDALEMIGIRGAGMTAKYGMPRREMLNPTQEVQAYKDAIRAGLMTLPAAHRELGEDSDEVLQEFAATNQLVDQLELQFDSDPRSDSKRAPAAKAAA